MGAQCNISAYNAAAFKSEVTTILNFAENIEQAPTTMNKKIAKWLKKGLADKYSKYTFSNNNIIEINRIIENKSINDDIKFNRLLKIALKKEASYCKYIERETFWERNELLACGILYTGAICLALLITGIDNTINNKIDNEGINNKILL